MIKELDMVVLTEDQPAEGLATGDVGCVVMVYGEERAFEVEFATLSGETLSVVTLPAGTIRPVGAREIAHARRMA